MYTMEDFLKAQVSKATMRNYEFGLKSFAKWYKKPIADLLKEPDPGKTLEFYWAWLKQTYQGNTPRNKINTIIQYCKFNKINPEVRKGLHVNKQIASIRDHDITIDECKAIWKVSTLKEKILVKTWLLGIRAKDASILKWKDFEFGNPPNTLKLVRIITQKEDIEAQLFIDDEFQSLLKEYINTIINKKNPFLLQSNKGGKISEKQLSRKIQSLRKRAGVKIKPGKTFGWHLARYLRSRMGTEYDLSSIALKMMIGHSTGVFGKYAKRSEVSKTADKLSRLMKMEPETESKEHGNLEEILEKLGIAMAKELTKNAIARLRAEGMLGLQSKEELDPKTDWLKIIENYIAFDEVIPPEPNRLQGKMKELKKT